MEWKEVCTGSCNKRMFIWEFRGSKGRFVRIDTELKQGCFDKFLGPIENIKQEDYLCSKCFHSENEWGSWVKLNFGRKSKRFSFLRFVQYSLKFLRFGNWTHYCWPKKITIMKLFCLVWKMEKNWNTSLRSSEPFRVKFSHSISCKRNTLQFAVWPFMYRSQKTSKRQAYFLASLIHARRSFSSVFSSYFEPLALQDLDYCTA